MLTYLVTGGAGFIGSNYIHFLREKYGSTIKIINIDALTYAGNIENLRLFENDPHYLFLELNIANKDDLIDQIFTKHKIDYVVHFAAESHVDRSIMDSRSFILTNVLGTQSLLDCIRMHRVKKFVHVSTDEVYGSLGNAGRFNEDSPLQPNSPYAASKASSDLLVRAYEHTYGLPLCITRCSNNYGPYQYPEKLIPLIISNALENKPIPVYGTGENVRDWIFVKDHCAAIEAVVQKGKIGEVYNIGANSEVRNIDIINLILNKLGKNKNLIQFVADRPGHDFRYAIDSRKAQVELDWKAEMNLDQGLDLTIKWYLEQSGWLEKVRNKTYFDYYAKQYVETI